MTVTATPKRRDYTGDGVNLTFGFNWRVLNTTDLKVIVRSPAGYETTMLYGTDYTLTGLGNVNGGNVLFTAPPVTGAHITILPSLTIKQSYSFRNQAEFYGAKHEDAYDYLAMCLQQMNEIVGRAVVLPASFTTSGLLSSPVPGWALGVSADGTHLTFVPNTGADQSAALADTAANTNGSGRIGHNDALVYPAGTVGAFLNRFKDYANALYGAGMSGFAYALAYGVNTVGAAIKAVMDRCTSLETFRRIPTITATVGSNALTLGLAAQSIDFRSSPVSSGVVNTRTMGGSISLVVPAGATLGTVNAQQARLVLLAIDNAGTVELAVVNLAGGVNLDETTLVNTTGISTSSAAANVIYSQAARTAVPFRVVGYIDITEATAGTWATAPSTIQGVGGQALAALSSMGYGQTPQLVTRTAGTTYYNTTGKPIQLWLYCTTSGNNVLGQSMININGSGAIIIGAGGGGVVAQCGFTSATVTIPAGVSYLITLSNATISAAYECR